MKNQFLLSAIRFNRISHVIYMIVIFYSANSYAAIDYDDERDPFENYNRKIYQFNEKINEYIMIPISTQYKSYTPEAVDIAITHFFDNLLDVPSALNNMAQLKYKRAFSDLSRVMINSTIGVLGVTDQAVKWGFESNKEDFGQTMGYWGIPSGPYLVLPLLGPTTVRDGSGLVIDNYINPISNVQNTTVRYSLTTIDVIDTHADFQGSKKIFDDVALDSYSFIKDAYLQKRLSDIHDGNPPIEKFDEL